MRVTRILILVGFLFPCLRCHTQGDKLVNCIIPQPVEMQAGKGIFLLDEKTVVQYDPGNREMAQVAETLLRDLDHYAGVRVTMDRAGKGNKVIRLELSAESDLPEEGYLMNITPREIIIRGTSAQGIFFGLQTLKQLILTSDLKGRGIPVPSLMIRDYPRFAWRGMHLDTGRHFYTVDSLKRFIDYLATYKLNRFHWHLTDDQGWRIEIKQYPMLTETGSRRKETIIGYTRDVPKKYDGIPYGGFYTRDEIRDVVSYASARYITVVPEIEMPGHAQAAIAAYPELGVTGDKVEVLTEWGVSPVIFKPSEEVFLFLETVLTEVLGLFPSEYIHIGGDEAIKNQWKASAEVQNQMKKLGLNNEDELQSWFIRRIEKFLNDRGRKLIGWDEILQGGLAPNATVMSWHGIKKGIEAAEMGHDVIMTPNSHLYFSYYQADPATEPPASRAGTTRIDKVYSYDPIPAELAPEKQRHILGVQACLWTEQMKTFRKVEYMMFPRITALAELAWTPANGKNYEDFSRRLLKQERLFRVLGVNYSRSGMPIVGN